MAILIWMTSWRLTDVQVAEVDGRGVKCLLLPLQLHGMFDFDADEKIISDEVILNKNSISAKLV